MPYTHSQINANNSFTERYLPWLVWGLACCFYFYESLLQVSPSVMSNELMRDFGVTGQTLGILSGIYFYSYAAMQLPGGILLDYFGPHKLLSFATTICALSTIAFGLTDNFFMASIARLMIGFGSAFAAIGCMKLAANWFSPTRFAFLTGLMVTIGMLGAIGGEAPLALLVDHYDWRNSMIILGVVGLILAVLITLIAKDAPKNRVIKDHHSAEESSLWTSFIAIMKRKQLWLVAIYGGLIYTPTPVFCGLWGVPFLMFKFQLTKPLAANYISLIFIGWAIASPLWGIFSNRIGRRKPPMYIAAFGALITSLLFLYAPLQAGWFLQLTLFAFGVFSSAFLSSFSIAKEICSQKYVATGLSFMNMMNMIGIALAQPAIGFILDRMWQGQIENKVRIYPLEAYYFGLALIPLGILISLFILPRIKETYCQQVH